MVWPSCMHGGYALRLLRQCFQSFRSSQRRVIGLPSNSTWSVSALSTAATTLARIAVPLGTRCIAALLRTPFPSSPCALILLTGKASTVMTLRSLSSLLTSLAILGITKHLLQCRHARTGRVMLGIFLLAAGSIALADQSLIVLVDSRFAPETAIVICSFLVVHRELLFLRGLQQSVDTILRRWRLRHGHGRWRCLRSLPVPRSSAGLHDFTASPNVARYSCSPALRSLGAA
mmetsp:Transcript_93167/g.272668  ORF Transcript_93167/g.272668 Transcript_93167/m.272668 type:complete len:232 (+) Transcript_93167:210-905(+)